jgi:hypothetical protein
VRSVTLGVGQKCPQSTSTEIVVCSTLDQPYRIPKQFRDSGPIPAQNACMPPPVPIDSTRGAPPGALRPKFSATRVVKGKTVDEPTAQIWVRARSPDAIARSPFRV